MLTLPSAWRERSVPVDAPSGAYPVVVGRGARAALAGILESLEASRGFRVRDAGAPRLGGEPSWPEVEIPGGEGVKTFAGFRDILDALVREKLDRSAVLVATGGGATLDVAGFAAATYLRGIRWVAVPTTLLAMVDASVGGKTGIDHEAGKNLVGAFHHPSAVACDLDYLGTLPEREVASGLAEVVKHALIGAPETLALIEGNVPSIVRDRPVERLEPLIRRSLEVKAAVVARDEREQGLRRVLNFGHTLGHAIEAAAGFGPIRHGEAVLFGMEAAIHISLRRELLRAEDARAARDVVREVPRPSGDLPETSAILTCLEVDKKRVQGRNLFVLLEGLGRPIVAGDVSSEEIREALLSLRRSP